MSTLSLAYKLPFTADLNPTTGAGVVTFSRASVAWLKNDAGVYTSFASGVPAINSQGLLCEPARINRCTSYNANPDAGITNLSVSAGTIVRVLRTKQLANAGLQNICSSGYMWRFNNTTGASATITIAGAITSTNAAALSLFAQITGTACTLQLTGGKGAQLCSQNTSINRFISENIGSVAGTEQLQIVVPAGTIIEWVLAQAESGADTTTAGVTSPIVTAGATAVRAATSVRLPSTVFPANNFVVYNEYTCHTVSQDNKNPMIYISRVDSNNSISCSAGSGTVVQMKVGGTARLAHVKNALELKTINHAALFDAVAGVYGFTNGSQGYANAAASADFAATTIYLGTSFDTSQAFIGQIRNFTVYTFTASPLLADVQALTVNGALPSTDLGAVGVPIYDRGNPGRIWALRHNSSTFNVLSYSDNYGDSWIDFVTLSTTTTLQSLQMDMQGNFYYGTATRLYKITAAGVELGSVIIWAPVGSGGWSFTNWSWGQDSAGNLYCAAYYLSDAGHQRIWKSTDGGNTWAAKDALITNYPLSRHVHSLRVIPKDTLYVSWGDGADRGAAYSADGLATAPVLITETMTGPTCISYSDEGVYFFSDQSGSGNGIDLVALDNSSATPNYTMPNPGQLAPIYFGALAGSDEIWYVTRNDNGIANQFGTVGLLKKQTGRGNNWSLQASLGILDSVQNSQLYYGLAHDGTGIIPAAAPYIFVGYENTSEAVNTVGVLRIKRDAALQSGLGATPGQWFYTPGRGMSLVV